MIDRIDRKREVLVHVAKYCFEGTLEAHKEFIPLEIVPHGSQPTHRCCVYREREVLRNRVDWACGRASVYDGENHYTFTDQPVAVMNSACEGCPLQRYTVTIPQRLATPMLNQGDLTLPMPGLYVLANTDNLYSNILGLVSDADVYNPSGFAL